MQKHCQFCHAPIVTEPTSRTLGGPYFCSSSHAMKFFRGEDYYPPREDPAQPPFFERTAGPRLAGKEVIASR